MSTQSVIHNTKSKLAEGVDELYKTMGYLFKINQDYGVGKSYSRDTFRKVKIMERIMCEENCRLGGIEDKIKEKLNLLILNCR